MVMATQRGFILVAVLWVLVGMTVAAGVFAAWVDSSRERAEQLRADAWAQRDAQSALAAIVYTRIIASGGAEGVPWPGAAAAAESAQQDVGFDNLEDFFSGAPARQRATTTAGFLRMDDSPLAAGDLRLIVQDRAGLIGLLDIANELLYQRLAGAATTPQVLRDTLQDYMDEDQRRRTHGAEAQDYQRLGRPPPQDGVLRSPLQLRDILHWDEVLASRSDAWILRHLRVDGGSFINANTAPRSAMELVLPQPQFAAQWQAQRRQQPLTNAMALSAEQGIGEDIAVGVTPGDGIRLWWWREGSAVATVHDVQFDAMIPGRDAVFFNWTTRVALDDETVASEPERVDHPFFRATANSGRRSGGAQQ